MSEHPRSEPAAGPPPPLTHRRAKAARMEGYGLAMIFAGFVGPSIQSPIWNTPTEVATAVIAFGTILLASVFGIYNFMRFKMGEKT